jgi:hypothetical protein
LCPLQIHFSFSFFGLLVCENSPNFFKKFVTSLQIESFFFFQRIEIY